LTDRSTVRKVFRVTNDLLKALSHPLRRDVLRELQERPPTSPRDVADLLAEPLSNVGYHFRVLRECAAIELVKVEPVRGSIQHFYRFAIEDPWALAVLDGDEEAEKKTD
jgi:DNA-binding transcriptional ArsR family regulator